MIPDLHDLGKIENLRTEQFQCLVATRWRNCVEKMLAAKPPTDWTEWEEIKSSTVRTIYRGTIPGPDGNPVDAHLKLFRAVSLSDRARDAIGGSRSVREFRNLVGALERGLPCVEPIAAGSILGHLGSQSFLLTRTKIGEPLPRGPLPPDDAQSVGRLILQSHEAGLHARDLHPGNILRLADGSMVLVDLTSAVLADRLNSRDRGRALAFFCLDLDAGIEDPAARPILEAYGANETVLEAARKNSRRLRNRALSSFGRRAFRPCKTTQIERAKRKPRVYLHTPAQTLWDRARELIDKLPELEPVKSGRRGAVYLEDGIVIKVRSAAAARRLFESAYWLRFAGVPTPMPVALQTFRSTGTIAVQRLAWPNLREESRSLSQEESVAAAQSLGESVGRLHSFGLRNRDLKFENLVRNPDSGTVSMVDLDGVKRRVPTDDRGRASDLGRLLAAFWQADQPGGETVIREFLRAYVRTCRRLLYPVLHRRHLLDQAVVRASQKCGLNYLS
ncbi:MAG: lipopolysaccharide kinase InaA family protein [Planctomycetota bacterium]|nr:lipopolysaccharide kinase InaA family protein [Planctomycetota bacterium]